MTKMASYTINEILRQNITSYLSGFTKTLTLHISKCF